VIEQTTVPSTPAGYQQLLRLANRQEGRRVWAIESTGGDGAGRFAWLVDPEGNRVELWEPAPAVLGPADRRR
jgi:hypothetical protein